MLISSVQRKLNLKDFCHTQQQLLLLISAPAKTINALRRWLLSQDTSSCRIYFFLYRSLPFSIFFVMRVSFYIQGFISTITMILPCWIYINSAMFTELVPQSLNFSNHQVNKRAYYLVKDLQMFIFLETAQTLPVIREKK